VDAIYAATEPLQWRIQDAAPSWASLVWPRTERWQRELLRDKRMTSAFLATRGVPIPEQREVDSRTSDAGLSALGTPVVVKGSRGRGGSTTRIAGGAAAARDAIRALEGRGVPCFLQRHVPGATYLAGGVFDDGHPLRWYTGVKRVQQPAATGPAAVIESLHDATLDAVARRVFAAMRVSGLASADFIRDRDGRFLFLELNPRPWGSIAAAREAGVDLFTSLAALIAGEDLAADLSFTAGVRSTVLPLYLLSPACWGRAIAPRALLRDLRGAQGAMFREPGQAMHLLSRLVRVGRNWSRV
jgi:biotin carboxylase